jgi:hypothetical protein
MQLLRGLERLKFVSPTEGIKSDVLIPLTPVSLSSGARSSWAGFYHFTCVVLTILSPSMWKIALSASPVSTDVTFNPLVENTALTKLGFGGVLSMRRSGKIILRNLSNGFRSGGRLPTIIQGADSAPDKMLPSTDP